jgi:hypothetical protein
MHHLIDQRRADIAVLCRRYGVRQLEVFGSAARAMDFDQATAALTSWVISSQRPDASGIVFGLAYDLG